MTNSNNKRKIDDEVRRSVARYEDMISRGLRDYFDEDDLLDVADYYYNDMSRKEDALQCLEYALQLHPDCLSAILMKAEIFFFNDKRNAAWKLIDGIQDKSDPDVLYYRGLFNLEEGRLEDADSYYKKAYFAQMGDCVEIFCQIVWDYLDRGIIDKLENWYGMLPNNLQEKRAVLETKAEYFHLLSKFKEAIAIEEKLIDSDPYNVSYWNAITRLYCLDDNLEKAYEGVTYALDINPNDTEALMLAAEVSSLQENYEKSHEFYERYIRIDDKNSLAYFNNARTLMYCERYREALWQLHYALKYCEDQQIAKLNIFEQLSTVLWALGDLEKATVYLDKARGEKLGDEMYTIRRLSIDLKGNKDKNIGAYVEKLLEYNIKSQGDPCALLYLLTSFKKYAWAKKVADIVMAKNPKHKNSCYPFLSLIAFYEHDDEKFLMCLEKAIENVPNETRRVFAGIFPDELDVKDYYAFAVGHF